MVADRRRGPAGDGSPRCRRWPTTISCSRWARSVNFFGVEGAGDHAFPLYTLADAVRLKEHMLERWEAADRDPELVDDGVLNVVFVGGGPTGIESAGALAELYRSEFAKDYPHLPQDRIRLVLVEAGDDVFTMFKPDIREYTRKALEERGVEVMLGETVASVTPTRVQLASGHLDRRAHAGLGRRACRPTRSARRSASSSPVAAGSRSSPT